MVVLSSENGFSLKSDVKKNNLHRQFLYIKPSESLKYVVKAIEYLQYFININRISTVFY